MFIRMLTAMAGEGFSYGYGETVAVEDRIGKAWIKASVAELAPTAAASERAAKDLAERVADLEAALAEAEADRDACREQATGLAQRVAELEAALAAHAESAPAA